MAGKRWIIAPHRIVDDDLGRVMFGTGERVPIADAIRYGLIEAEPDPEPQPRPKGKKAPAEDRARKPAEDRKRGRR